MQPTSFVLRTMVPGILKARHLRDIQDSEHEPFRSKYAAADLLHSLAQHVESTQRPDSVIAHSLAYCHLERGLALIETDLASDAQKALEQGLAYPWPASPASKVIQQAAHNALAGLLYSWQDNDSALEHLEKATDLYSQLQPVADTTNSSNGSSTQQPTGNSTGQHDSNTSASDAWDAALFEPEQMETEYTTTLFFLAQVHGQKGNKVQSAAFCAATLNRQLKAGNVDRNEWVQNCLHLSGYFLDVNAFALSQYCCTAIKNVLLLWQQQQHDAAATQATSTTGDTHQQQAQPAHQIFLQSSSSGQPPQPITAVIQQQEAGQRAGNTASTAAREASLEDAQGPYNSQKQNHLSREQQSKQESPPKAKRVTMAAEAKQQLTPEAAQWQSALQQVDADVAANVQLGLGKCSLYCLAASHKRFVEGQQLRYTFTGPTDVPDVLCFDAVPNLPELSSLQWGGAALAADYGAASQLFKQALPWYTQALNYNKLDGWVTEHCHILFEMSNLYRCLAGFEHEPHRRCVMHRARAKLLEPLEGQLSVEHYPGLSRSISLELGNIFKEIADIKAAAGREREKVTAAGLSAAQHYQLFLDSFKGSDGALPSKVEADTEQHYLTAAFSLARILQSAAASNKGPRGKHASLHLSIGWLDTITKYVKDNNVTQWQQEAELASEMAVLLKEKLALGTRLSN